MDNNLLEILNEYRKRHPEVDDIIKKFRMTQDEYQKALSAISVCIPKSGPTYATTLNQSYNADVATPT